MKAVLSIVLLAVVLGVIGALSVWVQQPVLVPSLGSAAFLQILTPDVPSSRAWNVGMGQILGAAGGFTGVFVAAAGSVPHFMAGHPLMVARLIAAVIAVTLTAAFQVLLKATNAAGGATALVIALGAETATAEGAGRLLLGILLVTGLGEAARHLLLRVR